MKLSNFFKKRELATIYLVMMCCQFVAIEGYGVSPVKVAFMGLAPVFFLINFRKVSKHWGVSKPFLLGMLYWSTCVTMSVLNNGFQASTLGYLGLFCITFIMFAELVYKGAFNYIYFLKLLRVLIFAYCGVLVLQQMFLLIGIHSFPIINLANQHFLSLTKLPSLTIEPSHSARLLTVLFLCYLRMLELRYQRRVSISDLFTKNHRWLTVLFIWAMLTMGSGTAFTGLGLLSFYFVRGKGAFYAIPALCLFFFLGQSFQVQQFDRAWSLAKATKTLDVKEIVAADGSGADRVTPVINTFFNSDFSDVAYWIGRGAVTDEDERNWWKNDDRLISVVQQYGIIAFVASILLVYKVIIWRFFSLETAFFLVLFGANIGNIYYVWGAMMLFTTVTYFRRKGARGRLQCAPRMYPRVPHRLAKRGGA